MTNATNMVSSRLGVLFLGLAVAACGGGGGGGGGIAPVASFTASPTVGVAPHAIQFTDTSTNAPTSWQWDFDGDGAIDATQKNPAWTYTQDGVFSVRLVVANAAGEAETTRSQYVAVGLVPIAAGTFQMGSTAGSANEQPVRAVTLTKPFWMGTFEVTQAEYEARMGPHACAFEGEPDAARRPVENVTWAQASAYCAARTAAEVAAGRLPAGYQYRLPTEAEWEYCCRAGTTTEWHTGVTIDYSQANYGGERGSPAHPRGQTTVVGSYAPNPWGLYDMHGNVAEHCLDAYDPGSPAYPPGAATDPYAIAGSYRALRGGGWDLDDISLLVRSASRSWLLPISLSSRIGFRVVLAPTLVPLESLQMQRIAPGTFAMGSTAGLSNEQPVHAVTLSQPFWIGRFEVSQQVYESVADGNPSYHQGLGYANAAQRPVEQVSWNDAVAFCAQLTERERAAGRIPAGHEYRLPTEAEWEYCCRAGTTTEWHTGASLTTAQANFAGLANQTTVGGSYAANDFGLCDMHGNVWEWCLDALAAYPSGPVTDPLVVGADRVIRGGSWSPSNDATFCRSAKRNSTSPGYSASGIGFRLVLAPVRTP